MSVGGGEGIYQGYTFCLSGLEVGRRSNGKTWNTQNNEMTIRERASCSHYLRW